MRVDRPLPVLMIFDGALTTSDLEVLAAVFAGTPWRIKRPGTV